MSRRFVFSFALAAASALATVGARTVPAPAAPSPPDALHAAIAGLEASARARDSLTAIADS